MFSLPEIVLCPCCIYGKLRLSASTRSGIDILIQEGICPDCYKADEARSTDAENEARYYTEAEDLRDLLSISDVLAN